MSGAVGARAEVDVHAVADDAVASYGAVRGGAVVAGGLVLFCGVHQVEVFLLRHARWPAVHFVMIALAERVCQVSEHGVEVRVSAHERCEVWCDVALLVGRDHCV